MTDERLLALLRYANLTDLADDPNTVAKLSDLYDMAVEDLADLGVERIASTANVIGNAARYDTLVNAIVTYWFDHGDEKDGVDMVPGARRLLNRLKRISF